MRKEHVEARILYADKTQALDSVDHEAVRALVERMQLPVESVSGKSGEYVLVTAQRVRVLIAYTGAPFALTHFKGVTRPQESPESRRDVLHRLAHHACSLTVVALDRNGADAESHGLKQSLVWEIVDYLLSVADADLVQCPGLNRLMTAEEADDWLQSIGDRFPEMSDREAARRDVRKEIFSEDPHLSPEVAAWLGGEDLRNEKDEDLLGAALREFLDLDSARNAEKVTDTAAGRSAVYVMSATIALFALPLGAAALSYNALSGGSVRVSGYAMVATGMYQALESLGLNDVVTAALPFI